MLEINTLIDSSIPYQMSKNIPQHISFIPFNGHSSYPKSQQMKDVFNSWSFEDYINFSVGWLESYHLNYKILYKYEQNIISYNHVISFEYQNYNFFVNFKPIKCGFNSSYLTFEIVSLEYEKEFKNFVPMNLNYNNPIHHFIKAMYFVNIFLLKKSVKIENVLDRQSYIKDNNFYYIKTMNYCNNSQFLSSEETQIISKLMFNCYQYSNEEIVVLNKIWSSNQSNFEYYSYVDSKMKNGDLEREIYPIGISCIKNFGNVVFANLFVYIEKLFFNTHSNKLCITINNKFNIHVVKYNLESNLFKMFTFFYGKNKISQNKLLPLLEQELDLNQYLEVQPFFSL